MTASKRLVVDANILLRAVFGLRVMALLQSYEHEIAFYSPDVCFEDARRFVPEIAARRMVDPTDALLVLERLAGLVSMLNKSFYDVEEERAKHRISSRDPDDWPIVAASLVLGCPIWTEDRDFFGSGVATWTTATVEVYLRGQ